MSSNIQNIYDYFIQIIIDTYIDYIFANSILFKPQINFINFIFFYKINLDKIYIDLYYENI